MELVKRLIESIRADNGIATVMAWEARKRKDPASGSMDPGGPQGSGGSPEQAGKEGGSAAHPKRAKPLAAIVQVPHWMWGSGTRWDGMR